MIFLLISVSAVSQEKTRLSGQIITTEPLNSPVHIINITREKGGLSELSGHFSVEVNIGDSLVFSSVQYKKESFSVTLESIQQNNFTIKLTEDLTELDEVKLHKFSGNLAKDISEIKTFNKFDLNAPIARKPPPSQVERQLFTATTGPGGSRLSVLGVLTGTIPLAPVMNAISGRTARLKKIKAKNEFQFTIEKAIYLISENTFIEDFEIPENEVMNFVYYCAENYDLEILLENPLELYEFFQTKSVEFKALSALD
ncbi:carboxypeptidase-like regulatory domain-containing protein [Salegentibacter sp. JZCK2]|uniref:carboxypeptidase-like regulatory domain-containing protein n=1 Tax=Salegentibacter tibetensis TaxID=2873600 RepID=UPI001CCB3BB8|nr:carboxypeptidase-like regulatory domain-containing protein [Salegentibacter tibetensis]MBZ9728858.1 carboxypeptidase-like regulatory domain-containing protein [Salegentibacter tibetensis]